MSRRPLAFFLLSLLSASQCAASCTDGVTPDCSDPAAQCGPIVDDDAGRDAGARADADADADG